ncbi:endonuclease/exonuclease/phosphatase family protein [Streptomyces sp. Ncost-T10-10d]|uniref:endonuclease/exonuclease/phosphatase family protein n=1 Tax=Streptomyces sp. Ncost-T10-10d TaxID=1839774 RepID=UPI00081D37EA|nr:endonuclease/exonuclease/phosphatase family protein [Streptomyces sp. Ncost-T10-10d]SCF56522.1 Metal-dependent hydrolase, endonuclease/exonuclease/phosphatase family [Streptomyces sp. Ncost-T10-10d]
MSRPSSTARTAWRATKVWLIGSMAVVAGLVTPAYAGPAAEEPLKPIPNRFMTWNTNGQDLGTPKAIAEQIKHFLPQVAALQESCLNEVREAVRQLNEAGLRYEYRSGLAALNGGCPGRLGTAIVYAKGTTVRAHNKKGYSDDEGWLEARGMQSFTTKLDGQWVRVFNTHLSAPGHEELRKLQAGELAAATRPHPRALILGDLNTRPHVTKVMDPIWQAGFKDVDQFCGPAKDPRCTKTLPLTGPPRTREESKYDYILGRGVNFRSCRLHTPTDDHRIVISDLTVADVRRPVCTVT